MVWQGWIIRLYKVSQMDGLAMGQKRKPVNEGRNVYNLGGAKARKA